MQLDAAHIVLGTKRGTSRSAMYHELGWAKLCDRRNLHKLLKVYCIVNKLVPPYLVKLFDNNKLSGKISTRAHANLCYQIPHCKTTFFQKSFVVSGMTSWNKLHSCVKFLPSKRTFKNHIMKLILEPKLPFNHNVSRVTQISFTQLRVGFSNLNFDLYQKGCTGDSTCACGATSEDVSHYLLYCPLYSVARNEMICEILDNYAHININAVTLLKGSANLSVSDNLNLFEIVYKFIMKTKRL